MTRTCDFSPVSASCCSSAVIVRSRASSSEPFLEVRRKLDREDAEVAGVVVELDRRVPRRARGLLVRGEERVLERLDQRALLDALLALDGVDAFDDLSVIVSSPRRSGSPARSRRTGCPRVRRRGDAEPVRRPGNGHGPLKRFLPATGCAVRSATVRPTAFRKWAGVRSGRSSQATRRRSCTGRGSAQELFGDPRAERVVDAPRMVDEDAETRRRESSTASTSTPGTAASTGRRLSRRALVPSRSRGHLPSPKKMGAVRPFRQAGEMWCLQDSSAGEP